MPPNPHPLVSTHMEWLSSLGVVGSVLRVLILLLEVILVFNLLIVVHEWGHFLAARWRGLKIEKFYVWFGKPLWKATYNGVEYGLGSIPLGGYVALPQMAPMDAIEGRVEDRESLPPISALDKIIVAFAGPLFSFLLACVFAVLVMFVGRPLNTTTDTTVGYVKAGSSAEIAGLRPGDKILEIDGTVVTSWDAPIDSVRERIPFSQGPKIKIKYQRPGETQPRETESGFEVQPGTWLKRTGLRTIGVLPAVPFKVKEVKENSPAALAGIKAGDVITHFNGEKLYAPFLLTDHFDGKAEAKAQVTIQQGAESRTVELTARKPDAPASYTKAIHGMEFGAVAADESAVLIYPNWWTSVKLASTMMLRTIGGLLSPVDNVGFQHLSGPLKIGSIYYQFFEQPEGWRMVLWFSVVLNVNLALMNLIPFPVLDGGHIVMGLVEMVRRRPIVQMRWLEALQTACALMLFGFMAYVSWFDAWDLAGGKGEAEVKFADIRFNPPTPAAPK